MGPVEGLTERTKRLMIDLLVLTEMTHRHDGKKTSSRDLEEILEEIGTVYSVYNNLIINSQEIYYFPNLVITEQKQKTNKKK